MSSDLPCNRATATKCVENIINSEEWNNDEVNKVS